MVGSELFDAGRGVPLSECQPVFFGVQATLHKSRFRISSLKNLLILVCEANPFISTENGLI